MLGDRLERFVSAEREREITMPSSANKNGHVVAPRALLVQLSELSSLSILLSPVRVSALKSASTGDLLKYMLRLISSDLLQRARTVSHNTRLCPVACHSRWK